MCYNDKCLVNGFCVFDVRLTHRNECVAWSSHGNDPSVKPVQCTFSVWLIIASRLAFRAMSSATTSPLPIPVASPKGKSKTRHVSPAMLQLRAQKEANVKALKELRKDMRKDPHHFSFLCCASTHGRVIIFCIFIQHHSLFSFSLPVYCRSISMHDNRSQMFARSRENINVW